MHYKEICNSRPYDIFHTCSHHITHISLTRNITDYIGYPYIIVTCPVNSITFDEVVPPSKGNTSEQHFQSILAADSNYQDNLDYDVHPRSSFINGGWNSNSYIQGILDVTNSIVIPLPGVDVSGFVGGGNPVPPCNFAEVQC